jgi:hypothetical protein
VGKNILKQHSELGASKAERWMQCPGSVNAERDLPNTRSEYAIEGTAAHTLAEKALRKNLDAAVWLDTEIDVEGTSVTVTEEMAEAVQVYLDYVRTLIPTGLDKGGSQPEWGIEEQFDLAPLNPPEPMFGTADFWQWSPEIRYLEVVDYKHGSGVFVQVEGNPQFLYYALGAVVKLNKKPKRIRVTVVQPRGAGDPVRSWEFDWETLVAFKRHLFDRAQLTQAVDAPRSAGAHCRFCKATATCPEQRNVAIAVAQSEFDVEPEYAPPAPDTLTDDQISLVLTKAPLVEDWIKAVRAYVSSKLDRGESVPGWKLVPKRATRKWSDEEIAEECLHSVLGTNAYTRKLRSPAQAEAALKEAKLKLDITSLVIKQSSGTNLVPADDPRPALTPSAQDDFEVAPDTPKESKGKRARSAKTK